MIPVLHANGFVQSKVMPGANDVRPMLGTDYPAILERVRAVLPVTGPSPDLVTAWLTGKLAAHLDLTQQISWVPEEGAAIAHAALAGSAAEILRDAVDQGISMLSDISAPHLQQLLDGDAAQAGMSMSGDALRVYTLEELDGRHYADVPGLARTALEDRFFQDFPDSDVSVLDRMIQDAWTRNRAVASCALSLNVAYAPTADLLLATIESNFAWTKRAVGEWATPEQIWAVEESSGVVS